MAKLNVNGRKLFLLSLLGICILAVSLLFLVLSASRPYMGIELSKGTKGWTVDAVDDTGQAKAYGISVGDKPVQINGQPAQIFLEKYEKMGFVWEPSIHQMTVINSQGQYKSVSLAGNSQSAASIIELTTWFFVCLSFWTIGYFVFVRRTQDTAALLLYICALVLGLAFSANLAAARGVPIAIYVEIAATLIGPWLLVHFFHILPDERAGLRNNPRVYLIYLPALITIILFPLLGYRDGQPVMWYRSLRLYEEGVGFASAIGVAIFNYATAISVKTRQQMKIVLIGCLAALIPILVLNMLPQAIWGQGEAIIPDGFSILFIIFIPVALGYAMVTQKLMDIDLFIRRSVIYGLITLVMAAIITAAILTIITFQKFLERPQQIIIGLILGGIATALFGPVRNAAEFVVDKYFYKDRYDYRQIIKSLNVLLNSAKDFSDASRLIVSATVQVLNLAGGCLYVKNNDGVFDVKAAQGIFVNRDNQEKLSKLISQRNSKVEFPNLATSQDLDIAYIIPLMAGGKEVGILCISQKSTKQAFSSDDLYLLEGIASVSAMALHSALLTRDVSIRDTFISIASHELRSPLTSVLGYTELLLNKDPPEATRKKWLKHILDNSQKVTDLVDDLLNVTRIQSGKVVMKLEKIKLSIIFDERIAIAQESTNTHKFVVNIEPNLPDVLVDRDKFGEVIGNLLSNAVKYSPNGGSITISAGHEPQSHRVVVSVIDEGIGIGPEDEGSLFTTFHRIQRPETRSIKGSGLGLYIAKEWTKAMGGEIWLKSELNKGSTFFVAVPAQDA
jgi:signal transduction histidine kinase